MPGYMPGSSSSEYRHIFKGSVWEKLLEQMKGGQGKGFHLLYLKSHLVSWQGKPQRIFFGDPATLKDLSLILLPDLKHRREKGWLVSVRQIWALWVMLITIPLMHLIWTIMLNLVLTFPTVLWKQTKVSSGQGYIILHVLWLLSKGQHTV